MKNHDKRSSMNKVMFNRICDEISTTIDSVEKICAKYGYSSSKCFYKYVNSSEENEKTYRNAKLMQSNCYDDWMNNFISDSSKIPQVTNNITGEVKMDAGYINWMSHVCRHHQWRMTVLNQTLRKGLDKDGDEESMPLNIFI